MSDRTLAYGTLEAPAADIRDHGYAIVQTRIERAPAPYRGTQCGDPEGCNQAATLVTLALAEITDEPGAVGFRFARDEDDQIIVWPVCDTHRSDATHALFYILTGRLRPDGIRAYDVPGQHLQWL
ncbi:hypothetical protein ACIQWB_35250 [Streptomyces olivaceus]|uniref:hypothetical protein n=1 Tax=Streptomyces olivaceus TaxID=47716 RepID=UPI00382BB0F5